MSEKLEDYATTDHQRAIAQALAELGADYQAIAERIGASPDNVRKYVSKLRRNAARRGWSPAQGVEHPTAEGYHLKKTNTLYDLSTGEAKARWVTVEADKQRQAELMREAIEELCEPARGVMKAKRKPSLPPESEQLMAAYYIGDHHHGMHAWAEETGADYDVAISERILNQAFDRLVAATPPARKGLIVSIGDFLHADNRDGRTARSGNILDMDTRHSKIIRSGMRCLRRQVTVALTKHEEVELLVIEGNHDENSSIWLAYAMALAFENEPRVTVRTDPRIFKYVVWGRNLLGFAHGHTCKPRDLPSIMAADQPAAWGESRFREFVHGHIHHETVKEERGCTVRSIKVLATPDAWHVGAGYRSERGMEVAVYHKNQGRVLTFHGTVEYITRQ